MMPKQLYQLFWVALVLLQVADAVNFPQALELMTVLLETIAWYRYEKLCLKPFYFYPLIFLRTVSKQVGQSVESLLVYARCNTSPEILSIIENTEKNLLGLRFDSSQHFAISFSASIISKRSNIVIILFIIV